MLVKVKLFGPQAQSVGDKLVAVELPASDHRCGAIRRALMLRYPHLEPMFAASRFAVNCEFAGDDTPVDAGDEVALIGQVSGG